MLSASLFNLTITILSVAAGRDFEIVSSFISYYFEGFILLVILTALLYKSIRLFYKEMKVNRRERFFLVLAVATCYSTVVISEETFKKEKQISEEYYDILFDKNKVGKVRLEIYLARFRGREVFVIEEEMNAVFLRGGIEMKTYSKSRTLSTKDLKPIGYWYEADEGGVKRSVMGLVSKDRRSIEISLDIGGIKSTKSLKIPKNAIFSNAFEVFIRRNLSWGYSSTLPLIMESDADVVEGSTSVEKAEPIDLCPNSVYKTTTTVAGIKNVEMRDASGWPVCVITPVMNVVFLRTDKKKSEEGFAPVDIFEQSLIKPNRQIKSINRLERVRIKLIFSSLELPEILEDEYQRIVEKKDNYVILEIRRIRANSEYKMNQLKIDTALKKYIEPTRYEQSTSDKIMRLAQEFVGDETDVIGSALRISNGVGKYIKGASLSKGYLSALEVYEEKVGDCTEYSVLTSALLKSLGIPTRLVMGLVYVDGKFGFHSWLDYWAGRWYSIDPTLNEEAPNPTHIRLWRGVGEPSELRGASNSALSFLNKVKIEVLKAEYK